MGFALLLLFTVSSVLDSSSTSKADKTPQDYEFAPADATCYVMPSDNDKENKSAKWDIDDSTVHVKNFYLWTRKTPNNTLEILDPYNVKSFDNTTFKPRMTFVAIHGFLGFGLEDWIVDLKDRLLKHHDCNVIGVDWPAGTLAVEYYEVFRRVRYVAQDVKLLFQKLAETKGFNVKDLHIVGHSLGAHLAGFSGKDIPKKYGRITGLDPAGLCFHNVKASDRLDRSDADYVDVIHTNGCYSVLNPWLSCYGIDENLGHADFWPNGGEYQPGCTTNDSKKNTTSKENNLRGERGCDHMMSYKYFVESVDYSTDDTYFLARNCTSWESFQNGSCSCDEEAQYMGLHADVRLSGKFYLVTNSSPPFAVRDAACAPGSSGFDNMFIIGVSAGSASLVLLIFIVALVCIVRQKSSTDDGEVASSSTVVSDENRDDALLIVPDDSGTCSDSDDSIGADDDVPILGASREALIKV